MKMLYEGSEIYTIGIMIQDIQTSLRNLRQGFGIRTQKKPRFRCATLFLWRVSNNSNLDLMGISVYAWSLPGSYSEHIIIKQWKKSLTR